MLTQQLLDALEALLLDAEEDPFIRVFDSLNKIFTFSQALLLAKSDKALDATTNDIECIVADPATLVGSVWPVGALFRKVMAGRVVTTFSNEHIDEWQGEHIKGLSPQQSALYLPVRVRDQRGILVLLRAVDAIGFDRSHIGLAQRFSVLASHALATRFAVQSAAESERLRQLTAQLCQSEEAARRNLELLNAIVHALPVGVAVQDRQGMLQVVNEAAALALGRKTQEPSNNATFALFDADAGEKQRRAGFSELLDSGEQRSQEFEVMIDGQPHTLLVTDKPVRIFDESLLLSTTLDITQRKRFEEQLSRQAFHDQLTGLPNRALMHEIVDTAIRANQLGGIFALAFIDLDNFKQINDYYSHAIGDAVLKAVAERISMTVRACDTLARISGDEFLLLINPLSEQEQLPLLINSIIDALKQPFHIEGHAVLTSASIGASIYPTHGTSYETLRRCADNAMYRAKNHQKGTASYFDLAMGNALTVRRGLEQRLRTAIREQRFKAAFQPSIDLSQRQDPEL
ncbi:MAG: diguanylate cyclase [Gammaproteobacteria bacterium]